MQISEPYSTGENAISRGSIENARPPIVSEITVVMLHGTLQPCPSKVDPGIKA